MTSSLVGSEMCIRDRLLETIHKFYAKAEGLNPDSVSFKREYAMVIGLPFCLLYTSDAADDM
eukprot:4443684-Prorocentrum_lima.AAC.1